MNHKLAVKNSTEHQTHRTRGFESSGVTGSIEQNKPGMQRVNIYILSY